MISVAFTGRLANDPILKTTADGTSVCSFSIAISKQFKPKDGGPTADFFQCVAWRQTAEFIGQYFSKGNMLTGKGSLQARSYTDKEGNKRTVVEIVVERAEFCESKQKRDDYEVIESEEDLPF